MHDSLRAFLSGLIDYAGLFPPAGLPLDEAIRNYARYRTEPEAWMLGRFICPVARLAELDRYVHALFQDGPPLALSVLAGKGNTLAELPDSLRTDLKAATAFQAKHGARVKVDVVEIRLPADQGEREPEKLQESLVAASEIIESEVRTHVTPFFEGPQGPGWLQTVSDVLGGIALANSARAAERTAFCRPAGFKVRCGGLEASAFPAPEHVANVIAQCRDRAVALKATAGLHHPFRRFHASLRSHMHGFINVFGAAVLAATRRLSEEQIYWIIQTEDPGQFLFGDGSFRLGEFWASTAEIATAREQFATSFGSCSFDEPREDLRALGLLE
jgi:hypothetical protein